MKKVSVRIFFLTGNQIILKFFYASKAFSRIRGQNSSANQVGRFVFFHHIGKTIKEN